MEKIQKLFTNKFKMNSKIFKFESLTVDDCKKKINKNDTKPIYGVYIWAKQDNFYRVGKSHCNPYQRAIEHIIDNTCNSKNMDISIKKLSEENDARIIVISTEGKTENLPWVIALEAFLEINLKPLIASRVG
ncbi:MAG TPA: hypothetical protein PKY81_14925 [bacterium]|nr:hypothetical protein [bacterium]